jgi:hypothetical protein
MKEIKFNELIIELELLKFEKRNLFSLIINILDNYYIDVDVVDVVDVDNVNVDEKKDNNNNNN